MTSSSVKPIRDEKTPFERVSDFIDEIADPENMSEEDYKEFLEELETDIAGRLEDLDEEESDDEVPDLDDL